MKILEIREKNKEELQRILLEKRELVRKIRFDISSKQVKNHRQYRNTKKDVSKIMTVLAENKTGAAA